MRLLLILACITITYGCSFIARTVNHAKKPKTETGTSVLRWLEKNKVNNNNIITINPSEYYNVVTSYCQGPMLFNKKGDFVSVGYNYDGKFCPKGVDEFLKTLYPGFEKGSETIFNYAVLMLGNCEDTIYPKLNELYNFSRDTNGVKLSTITDLKAYDYTLVLPFSIFLGNTLQVKKLKTFLDAAAQNQSARINIIMLNFDKQKWWGEEWLKKINIKV